ncbi:MAG: lytic transglycosylase domain-containing protein [Deltaproteobacteria bacterium]|nr:lytic transglycosylase domain-containing protein [Deltaproteobacteria bacterium]
MRTGNTRTGTIVAFALLTLIVGPGGTRGQEQNESQDIIPAYFPYPAALRPQVEFWRNIFATYSKYQVVIHDSETMKVYKVVDFRPLLDEEGLDEATVLQIRQEQSKIKLEQVRSLLLKLHQCGDDCGDLTAEEQKIRDMYRNVNDPDKFRAAASEDRLRSQVGIRERFRDAIQMSRRYLHTMEEIFRRAGVPVELTRLPFIESSFNIGAYSKVGAAGIWQFMPATGRLYKMRINNVVDERRDPLVATEAAARLLRANYESLGTWPLAITAWNHGPGGVAEAVDTVGTTDIGQIIRKYHGKRFGFASRNFYPEFLAALDVEKNYENHFGSLQMQAPLTYDRVHIDCPILLRTAAHFANADEDDLLMLNPSLGAAVRSSHASVPHGYQLRVPSGMSVAFLEHYNPWQEKEKVRLAALEETRKARLATLKGRKRTHSKKVVASGKNGKRSSVRQEAEASDGKTRKPRG